MNCVAQFFRNCFSPRKTTRTSCGRVPYGTIQLLKNKEKKKSTAIWDKYKWRIAPLRWVHGSTFRVKKRTFDINSFYARISYRSTIRIASSFHLTSNRISSPTLSLSTCAAERFTRNYFRQKSSAWRPLCLARFVCPLLAKREKKI